jgi:hypothetical protein
MLLPRLLPFTLCCTVPIAAQWISLGMKGGLPLSSTTDTGRSIGRTPNLSYFQMKRYTIGPSVEIGLPFRLRLEADALYKRARRDYPFIPPGTTQLTQQGQRVDIWEIPLLLKYHWKARNLPVFAVAGSTLRRIEDIDIDRISIDTFLNTPPVRQRYTVSSFEPIRYGITVGGGLSWRLPILHLEPELRYTHWTSKRWMATTEQVEFLLGIRFPIGRTN